MSGTMAVIITLFLLAMTVASMDTAASFVSVIRNLFELPTEEQKEESDAE